MHQLAGEIDALFICQELTLTDGYGSSSGDFYSLNEEFNPCVHSMGSDKYLLKKQTVNKGSLLQRARLKEFQWGRGEGEKSRALSAIFRGEDNQFVEVTFLKASHAGAFTPKEQNYLNLFHLHMAQFFELSSLFQREKVEFEHECQSLKILNRPFWVVNGKLALIYQHLPQGLDGSGRPYLFQEEGVLSCHDEDQLKLLALQVTSLIKNSAHSNIKCLQQTEKDGKKLTLKNDKGIESFWLSVINSTPYEGELLVMIMGRKLLPHKQKLVQLHGLTQRQASLCLLLMEGKTLVQAAQVLDISVNTARNFLSACFRLLRVNNQSELIRLLYSETSDLAANY